MANILVAGPHPDDQELGMGGTIARLADQGHDVLLLDMTDGEPTPRCDSPEIRLEEARCAADVLGVHERVTLDLPNRRLFDTYEARVALAKVLRAWRPEVVIGFGHKTPMASPDHWQAMQITDAAVFYARLSKWPDVFDGLPEPLVIRRDECGRVQVVKHSLIAGFSHNGQFYTRDEAVGLARHNEAE